MQNWIINEWWLQLEWHNNKCMIEYEWMHMNDWAMNIWMYVWMYECMKNQCHECMNVWIYECMKNQCMNECITIIST